MTIPYRPDRAWLRAFCLAWSLIGASLGALVFHDAGLARILAPLAIAAPLAALGLVRPAAATRAYRVWTRLGGRYARVARVLTIAVWYHAVFTVTGMLGARIRMRRPDRDRSGWTPRATLALDAYRRTDANPAGPLARGWLTNLLSWSLRSGQYWASSLVPLVAMLRGFERLEPAPEQAIPTSTYTLY